MRQRDKVLDDLRNVQSRDCTSLKKASMSSHRTRQRIRAKVAKRKRPYGAKKISPIEPPKPPHPASQTDTSTTCGCSLSRQYRVRYSSTTGSCNCTATNCHCCYSRT